MPEIIQFLLRHGYSVLFLFVFAEQIGLPIPAAPMLLAVGALAGAGKLSLLAGLLVATAAAMASDLAWYELGKRRGRAILQTLCRISLEPDSCVRRTESTFSRLGPYTLLVAKFVPGLSTAAPPLAGVFRMTLVRFVLSDGAGTLLWAGAFMGAGFLFSSQLEQVADVALRLGSGLVALLGGGLAAYVAWKWIQRHRFLRLLRIARITPDELQQKIATGEELVVLDLRHALELELDGKKLPGARHYLSAEVDSWQGEIPRDREIVLYCS